jgi:gamma-glutamyltranspeptidase/glutathione hydrolase
MPNKSLCRRKFLVGSLTGAAAAGLYRQELPAMAWNVQSSPFVAEGARGAIATAHPLATQAGIDCFRRGGNAIDAAVAASLMLSVVDGHNSGLGGGGLALLRTADGKISALDGRETAPLLADASQYLNASGLPDSQISQEGPRAAAVPGLVALLERLSMEFGRLDWKTSLLNAASTAEDGYVISGYFARILQATANQLSKYPSSAAILLDSSGQPWKEGHRLQQADLAQSLRHLADLGSQWFYRGEFAERVERMMVEHDGLMRAEDLARYKTVAREPIVVNYRGHQVFGFPPPSSGGIHLAQMLGMLEPYDVPDIFDRSEATGHHLMLEVMKRAMADRVHWLGDADFASVPRGLLDPDYLRERSSQIDLKRATEVTGHGLPPNADVDLFGRGGHTTHVATADSEGHVVALTQTVNTSFGSKMVVPGTGIVLNNEMDDFSLAPGIRNAFGLLGSEANKIVPGKRPLSSMTPTILIDSQGRPRFSGGAAGGPRIITAVLQTLVRHVDLQMPLSKAISQPRLHHQWSPNRAVVENAMPAAIIQELRGMGHDVQQVDTLAVAQAISYGHSQLESASDPRVPSGAQAL